MKELADTAHLMVSGATQSSIPPSYSHAFTFHVAGMHAFEAAALAALQVLNFSIAYGKTAHGLSRDWGTSQQEAQETVNRWYSDRPEVCPPILLLRWASTAILHLSTLDPEQLPLRCNRLRATDRFCRCD